jgi:hypothetical protein
VSRPWYDNHVRARALAVAGLAAALACALLLAWAPLLLLAWVVM